MADGDDLLVEIGLSEKRYLAVLNRLEASSNRSAKAIEGKFARQNAAFVRGAERANKSANAFANGGLKQISMQLSQVTQQGAVTGNYLQAMSVQAADIGLAFGTAGIAIGALIPVLYGVAQGFMASDEASEDMKLNIQGAYSDAKSAIEAAEEAQNRYRQAIELTGVAQQQVTPMILESLRQEAAAREALAALELARLERQRAALQATLDANRKRLDQMVSDAQIGLEIGAGSEDQFVNSQVERSRLDAVRAVLDANEDIVLEIREQQAELDLVNALMAQGHGEAAKMVEELIEAANSAERVATGIASVDFSSAISGAQALAERLDISLHKAMQIMGLVGAAAQAKADAEDPVLDPRDPRYNERTARIARIRGMMESGEFTNIGGYSTPEQKSTRSSGGGRRSSGSSGGKSDAQKAEATAMREVERYVEQTRTAVEEYRAELERLEDLKPFFEQAGQAEAYARAVQQVNEEFKRTQNEDLLRGIEDVSDAMAQAIMNGENMGAALKQVFQQIAMDLLSSGIQQMLMSLFGFSGSSGGIFGNLFAGMFDGGGNIPSGKWGIAGENGPEIIQGPASVTSTADTARIMSGGSSAEQKVHVTVGVDDEGSIRAFTQKSIARAAPQIAASANSALMRYLKENGAP
jgi:hypothetical protein